MKKIILSLLVVSLFSVGQIALAEDASGVPGMPEVVVPQVVNEVVPASLDKEVRLDKIKNLGAKLIADRVNELNKLESKILKEKKNNTVSSSSPLVTDIEAQKTGLIALGVSIKAGTVASSTKALVKTIYTDYRIFAVFIPKIHYLRAIETLKNHIANLTERFVKVQTNIDAAKVKGQDVTVRQANLDKAKITLAEVGTSLATLQIKAEGLKPADYPTASKTVLAELKAGIKDAQVKIKTVRQSIWPSLAGKVKAEIKSDGKSEGQPAPKLEKKEKPENKATTTGLKDKEKKPGIFSSPLMRLLGR
ncbi:MAG: hypothetical protein NTV48_01300 [Candidatus Vogelbacteria bacterium]|nr:hypothetical protein [Candidatus Vogelbacteria bacterium]